MIWLLFVYAMLSLLLDLVVGPAFSVDPAVMREIVRDSVREDASVPAADVEEVTERRVRFMRRFGRATMLVGWPVLVPMMLWGNWRRR